MKISILSFADGEPVLRDEKGNVIEADYICWEWQRGGKPRVIIGVDSDSIKLEADINFPAELPSPIIK